MKKGIKPTHGFVYFLVNQAMPGLIKIGFTCGSLEKRMSELQTSGVPEPFALGAAFQIAKPHQCEAELHGLLSNKRANEGREFFALNLEEVVAMTLPIIAKYGIGSQSSQSIIAEGEPDQVDEDDIYFMQLILHDSYQYNSPIGTKALAKNHDSYHPLELERKLLHLLDLGFINRKTNRDEIEIYWIMTPKGTKFMFDGKHVLQDIIDDDKKHRNDKLR